ncbi:hypothetical protein ABPG72_013116 [Tetrahymena utriculariae]
MCINFWYSEHLFQDNCLEYSCVKSVWKVFKEQNHFINLFISLLGNRVKQKRRIEFEELKARDIRMYLLSLLDISMAKINGLFFQSINYVLTSLLNHKEYDAIYMEKVVSEKNGTF